MTVMLSGSVWLKALGQIGGKYTNWDPTVWVQARAATDWYVIFGRLFGFPVPVSS